MKRYFAGERVDFSPLVLDLGDQDEFFRQIYSAARRIGWGHTTTYGTLARERCNEARGTRRRACGSRSMPMRCPG